MSSPQRVVAPPDAEVVFEDVYEQQFDFVWNVARRFGVAERDLPDVVHDVFVVVFRQLADWDRARPLRPWLFGITFRVSSSHRRRGRDVLRSDDHDAPPRDESPTPDTLTAQRQERALVHTLLEELSPERRAVLVAHELEELPMPALAEALNVPVKTLYSRLRAAREDFVAALRRHTRRGP